MTAHAKIIVILLLFSLVACRNAENSPTSEAETAEEEQHTLVYGIVADNYRTEQGKVGNGETLGKILNRYGVSAVTVDKLDKAAAEVFPLRKIRAGRPFTAVLSTD